MCYTGICLFEYSGGESVGGCQVCGHQRFTERYGESPCIVGMCPQDPEEEEYIANNRERLEAIYGEWIADRYGRHKAEHERAAAAVSYPS